VGSSLVGSGEDGKGEDGKSYTEGTEVGAQRAQRGCWRRDGRRLGSIEERFLTSEGRRFAGAKRGKKIGPLCSE